MAKKAKKAVTSKPQSSTVSFENINDVITTHNARVSSMIENHMRGVANSTGKIQPEDISYVINLSNRELEYSIKQLFQPNVL